MTADGAGEDRAAAVRQRVAAAARQAGHPPDAVRVLAVAKGHPLEAVRALYDLGFRDFGENRVQEARGKYGALGAQPAWIQDIRLHLIGHLHSNKVKLARDYFQLIQSVDRINLAAALQADSGAPRPIMVEVNAGREPQKHGLWPDAVRPFMEALGQYPGVRVVGLMAVLPRVGRRELEGVMAEARRTFLAVREEEWPWAPCETLSMGMSEDFEMAIRHGSTEVRIGTALFGPRPLPAQA